MITIQKNTTKTCIFTLKEKSTLTTPYYTFSLLNNDDKTNSVFSCLDTSLSPDRYNAFVFTEGVSGASYTGEFLLPEGSYNYTVFECSAQTLITTGLNPVEFGLLMITGTGVSYVSYEDTSGDETFIYRP